MVDVFYNWISSAAMNQPSMVTFCCPVDIFPTVVHYPSHSNFQIFGVTGNGYGNFQTVICAHFE